MKRLLSSTSPLLFVAVLAGTGLVAACTITTASDATPDGGASSSGGSSGTSSSSGDGGASSSSGGETGNGKYGVISMSQTSFTAGQTTIDSYSLFASFSASTPKAGGTGTGSNCTTSTEGACTVMDCTIASGGDAGTPAQPGDAGSAKAPNAGDIAVNATLDVTLTPDGTSGVYPTKSGQVKLFAPEEEIAIDAKGDDVPAFKTTLTAPSLVTITSPTWPAPGQPLQIDRSKALDLKWSDGKSGNIVVSVTSSSASKVGMVSCTFKASDGAGTVPAAALGKLDAAGSSTIAVTGSSTSTVTAGDYTVNVSATSPAKAGSSLASGQAKLQ